MSARALFESVSCENLQAACPQDSADGNLLSERHSQGPDDKYGQQQDNDVGHNIDSQERYIPGITFHAFSSLPMLPEGIDRLAPIKDACCSDKIEGKDESNGEIDGISEATARCKAQVEREN